MSTYRCARATTSHAADDLDGGGGVFLRVESRAARPGSWMPAARQGSKKTGLDARRGPASWERPARGGNASLRHACAHQAPGGSRHAPHDGPTLSLPIWKYLLIRRISMGAAPAATRLSRLFGTPRAREVAAHQKGQKTGSDSPKRRNDAGFLDVYGRTPGVWTYRRTNAHDEGRAWVAGLPTKLPITPSSSQRARQSSSTHPPRL